MSGTDQNNPQEIIPNLFRTEYSNLVAVLCNFYGLSNVQLAQDIVSDTFYQAMQVWKVKGVPDNQIGWLRTVAVNKTKDHYRRNKLKNEKVIPAYTYGQSKSETFKLEINDELIKDSKLKMIFAVSHPKISLSSQLSLALRILCGFSIDEISAALLSTKETINKKLYRAKSKLRELNLKLELPSADELPSRLDAVLKTIYLLFNEGYYSSCSSVKVRKDLCIEAMRLTMELSGQKQLKLTKVNALMALMCFQASRFDARVDSEGDIILFDDQDRAKWDKELIQKGELYLNRSAKGKNISKYHLEAAIAYWHTTDREDKWENILQLYNSLLVKEYSPIAALNRTYALSKANSLEEAITEALKLKLEDNHLYFSLLAQLYHDKGDDVSEKKYLLSAIEICKTDVEKKLLNEKLNKLL